MYLTSPDRFQEGLVVAKEIPEDPLSIACDMQLNLLQQKDTEAKMKIAELALNFMGNPKDLFGGNKLVIHTLSAFIIKRNFTTDKSLREFDFGEVTVKGHFGGINYFKRNVLDSLCIDLYDPVVVDPVVEEDPRQGKLTTPLLIPVLAVESAIVMN